jgi:subtilase family serine protease
LLGWTDSPQPDYPASDANVTAVGGTSLAITKTNTYQFETGWGTYEDDVDYSGTKAAYFDSLPGFFWAGAGGGTSTLTPQPDYQKHVVPSSLSKSGGGAAMRVVPDVAATADPYTGFAIGVTDQDAGNVYQIEVWGGTSLACPLFAGMQALVSQNRKVDIGFANPLIYQAPALTFNDVRPPTSPVAVADTGGNYLITFDNDSSLKTAAGYDDVTGRGSPIAPLLVKAESVPTHTGTPVLPPPGRPHPAV